MVWGGMGTFLQWLSQRDAIPLEANYKGKAKGPHA